MVCSQLTVLALKSASSPPFIIKKNLLFGRSSRILLFYFRVTDQVAPEIAPFDFGDSTLNAGEAAQTQCIALKGDTPLNFTWTFHGDTSTFQTGVVTASVGQRSSALMIDSVSPNHAGTYTCTVRNQASSASYSTVLSVTGWFRLFHVILLPETFMYCIPKALDAPAFMSIKKLFGCSFF